MYRVQGLKDSTRAGQTALCQQSEPSPPNIRSVRRLSDVQCRKWSFRFRQLSGPLRREPGRQCSSRRGRKCLVVLCRHTVALRVIG